MVDDIERGDTPYNPIEDHAAPGSANPLVEGGDKAEPQGLSSPGEGTRHRVVVGYDHVASAPNCPYCGDRHYCFEDDGNPDTYLVRCWCGAKARARKDDPDMVTHLAQRARM
jgi:hypothetical protein